VKETGNGIREIIRERIQYCLDGKHSSMDNQPVLFYMSVVCKNPLYLKSTQEPEVIGYTFSDYAYLNFGFTTDVSQPVAESGNNNVVVYPNPFTDNLNILVKKARVADIALYSADGKLLAKYPNLNEVQIATSKLPAGIYVVKVTADGNVETVTVVKK